MQGRLCRRLVLAGLIGAAGMVSGGTKDLSLTLLYSNTTNGVWQGCNCPRGGNGGLGRRLTVIKQEKTREPHVLLIDSGDMLSVMPDSAKARVFFQLMQVLKYDFINIGDQEFVNGVDFLKGFIEQGKLPFYSASLKYVEPANGTTYPLAPPYQITEVAGRKVGLIGVTGNDAFKFFPAKSRQQVVVTDAEEVLPGILSTFKREGVGIVIVVSHCGYPLDRKLAERFSDIDIIIGGHTQTLLEKPEKAGHTLIVQAGEDGARLGKLRLTFDANDEVSAYSSELFTLGRDVASDPQIDDIIKQYQEGMAKNKFWR
jgi:2',3'-cyclic-nucleotide 2'-phosphodiesterase (5'-nucleotidase family)